MKKLNTILSFASLVFTSFLLVFLIFAWYATNKTASVNDATGSVADLDNIVEKVEYYNFQAANGNTYTVRQYVKHQFGDNEDRTQIRYYSNDGTEIESPDTTGKEGYDGHFEMNKFDFLKQGFSKYLIKLTLKPGKSLGHLQFLSNASYFIGFDGSEGNGSVTNVSNLSMSSVIKFGVLTTTPTIAADKKTVTITETISDDSNATNHYEHFDYTHVVNNITYEYNGAISQNKKTLVSGLQPADENDSVVVYLLVDYNVDALNAFYGYNLSTSGNWSGAPQFTNLDFKIFILG